jgi:hypothetical protein
MVRPDIIAVLKDEIAQMAATINRLEQTSMGLKEGQDDTLASIKAETISDLKSGKADLERLLAKLEE